MGMWLIFSSFNPKIPFFIYFLVTVEVKVCPNSILSDTSHPGYKCLYLSQGDTHTKLSDTPHPVYIGHSVICIQHYPTPHILDISVTQ